MIATISSTISDGRKTTTSLVSLILGLHVVARPRFGTVLVGPGSRWFRIGYSRPRRRGLSGSCIGEQLACPAAAVAGEGTRDLRAVCGKEARKQHEVSNDDACSYLTDTRRESAAF